MSFLGIRAIAREPGGFDQWAFSHARHHDNLTTTLNLPVAFTGNTISTSKLVQNLSSATGLYVGMGLVGSGISIGTTITGLDAIGLTMTMSNAATATAAGVSITAAFQPIAFFILNPINPNDPRQFLFDHQNSHNAINAALGQPGNDLQDVDFNDQAQVDAWLDLNFTEHQTWNDITGVVA